MRCPPLVRIGCAALLALAGAACSAPPDEGAPPTSGAPDATSVAHDGDGYRFVAPAGWTVRPRIGSWQQGVSPARDTTGFDRFTSPEGDPWLVVGSRPAPPGVSLDGWLAEMTRTRSITYGDVTCVPPESTADVTLDGDPAQLRWFHCPVDGPDALAVHVLSVHGARGFVLMCYTEHVDAPPRFAADCRRWLRGFSYQG